MSNQASHQRPDPEVILRRIQAEENRTARATLKIFFGYAPGVGKTYTMLESAKRLKEQGIDIAIGCVETHGRPETAELMEGLEIISRCNVNYRGTVLAEFDLDRALLRKPKVLLLDELAHTNAPGSRHNKRWQDVLEILEAGIDVYTTLNVQHVESLNDIVSQITFVRVRETVPDSILERADEIELVDLPPDELLERLRDGKVYIPEQAQQAINHFFRRGNLLALRELTLRRAAERVDVDVLAYRREHDIKTSWPSAEKILVCVGPSPSSAKIIRGARIIAAGLCASWVAAYVEAPDAYPMTQEDRDRLQAHLRLAETLEAEVVRLTGGHVSEELLRYAREHNVTRIVIGKPTHSMWRDLFKGSLVNQLVRGSGDIEVHFIAGDEVQPQVRSPSLSPSKRIDWRRFLLAFVPVGMATGLSFLGKEYLSLPDVVMLYLLSIMVVAFRFGLGPAMLTSALSVSAYDFFFVSPLFTFHVSETRHLLTFAMMFAVGLMISTLTARLRRQTLDAHLREKRTAALYSLSRELSASTEVDRCVNVTVKHSQEVFGGEAALLIRDQTNTFIIRGTSSNHLTFSDEEMAVATWVNDHGRPAGRGTETLPGSQVTCMPLQSGSLTIGVLALWHLSLEMFEIERRKFLEAFIRQAALSIERARLSEEAKRSLLKARTEEMRSSLLSAVSHDLRTPLAAITGAGTTLREDRGKLKPEQRVELFDTICTEAERMEKLVANILDMVRIETGGIAPKREWVPLEEIVGTALTRLESKLVGREIKMDLPIDLPLVFVDPIMFEQVFVNLIENASKYTASESPVEISASMQDQNLVIEVADRGPGIVPGEEQHIFEKFYRGTNVRSRGVGLGLPICMGVVQLHGGTISVKNRKEGGAIFSIRVPLLDTPPKIAMGLSSEEGKGGEMG